MLIYIGFVFAVAAILFVIDWLQTLTISNHPDRWREVFVAAVIGEHPSNRNVHLWFLFWTAVTVAVFFLAPLAVFAAWCFLGAALEVRAVTNNFFLGIEP